MKNLKRYLGPKIATIILLALAVALLTNPQVAHKILDMGDFNQSAVVEVGQHLGQIDDEGLNALLQSVMVGEAESVNYDRKEWTSSSQWYACNKNHPCDGEYTSIRTYSFYESEWYDWNAMEYTDPYTGEKIQSVKQTDYDHIVPLAYANSHGGAEWTEEDKRAFADDPLNGVCCTQYDNRSKGAKPPSKWLPQKNVEDYCYTWLLVCQHYGISLSQEDMNAIVEVLLKADVGSLTPINEY